MYRRYGNSVKGTALPLSKTDQGNTDSRAITEPFQIAPSVENSHAIRNGSQYTPICSAADYVSGNEPGERAVSVFDLCLRLFKKIRHQISTSRNAPSEAVAQHFRVVRPEFGTHALIPEKRWVTN